MKVNPKVSRLTSRGKKVVEDKDTPAGHVEDQDALGRLLMNYDSHDALLEACARLVRAAIRFPERDRELEEAVECGLIAIGRAFLIKEQQKKP